MSKRNSRAADAASSPGTQPRPRDEKGRELDSWGLPLIGPARQRALAELGKPDPNIDPKAWRNITRELTAEAEQETPSDG